MGVELRYLGKLVSLSLSYFTGLLWGGGGKWEGDPFMPPLALWKDWFKSVTRARTHKNQIREPVHQRNIQQPDRERSLVITQRREKPDTWSTFSLLENF